MNPPERASPSSNVPRTAAQMEGPGEGSKSTQSRPNGPHSTQEMPASLRPADAPRTAESTSGIRSAKTSREASPARPQMRIVGQPGSHSSISRRNSQDVSPSRTPTLTSTMGTVPSAAAVQRALSAYKPHLQPTGLDGVLESSKSDRQPKGEHTPHWPGSPRLKSPPPPTSGTRSTIPTLRKTDTEPTPSAKRPSLASAPVASSPDSHASGDKGDADADEDMSHRGGLRTPARGVSAAGPALETVVESSVPTTPSIGPLLSSFTDASFTEDRLDRDERKEKPSEQSRAPDAKDSGESGSESGGPKIQGHKAEAPKPNSLAARRTSTSMSKKSISSLAPAKGKSIAEPLTRSMTVETETVTSIPQPLGVASERGAPRLDTSGSLRLKPSTETIRPKKDKKKPTRKPASLNAGTVTSKADIFEAKVASAVDEANSSDSEETFVYESNPPDTRTSNQARNHSRTPSATSLASQADHYGARYKQNLKDGNQSVVGKRSMKFTNNTYLDGELGNTGSVRGSSRGGSGTARHHHIGRYGRGGHASLFDADSLFTQANKPSSPRTSFDTTRRVSRPGSPRVMSGRVPTSPRKGEIYAYDIDDDGADDERTPLMGSVRTTRRGHNRRPNSANMRHIEYIEHREKSFFSRYGLCMVVVILILLSSVGGIAFLMAVSKPLIGVSVRHIQNVLASEQELMIDLDVRATNPNLFAILVNDLDVNLFAKSGFVGSPAGCRGCTSNSTSWTERRHQLLSRSKDLTQPTGDVVVTERVGEDEDIDEDPEGDPQTMLLGRILELDSPLVFEASPFRHLETDSVGEVRLTRPGNKTEVGGSAKWERVIQHPFELIVRGVVKYQLPLSSTMRSVSIGSRIRVMPIDDNSTKRGPKVINGEGE